MLELGVFSIFLENDLQKFDKILGFFFFFFLFFFFSGKKRLSRIQNSVFPFTLDDLVFFCLMNVYKNMKRQTEPFGKAMKK